MHCILKTLFLGFLQKFNTGKMKDEKKKGNVCNGGQGKEGILLGIQNSKKPTECNKE